MFLLKCVLSTIPMGICVPAIHLTCNCLCNANRIMSKPSLCCVSSRGLTVWLSFDSEYAQYHYQVLVLNYTEPP